MLVVRDLDVFYGGIQALRGVSLRVAPGELVTIVGPNGSGKTTLLRAISGLVPVAGGTITFAGTPIAGRPTEEIVRGGIAVVPEGRELWPLLTVEEHLRLGAYPLGRARRRARAAADLERVLSLFAALRPRLAQRAGTLSGGEQQMIAIARALMSSPRLLLLDEPSVGLAPIVIREIFRALGALRAEGLTILLVEQNARAAFRIADHGYALAPGGRMADVAAHGRAGADSARGAYGLQLIEQQCEPQDVARLGSPPPQASSRMEIVT